MSISSLPTVSIPTPAEASACYDAYHRRRLDEARREIRSIMCRTPANGEVWMRSGGPLRYACIRSELVPELEAAGWEIEWRNERDVSYAILRPKGCSPSEDAKAFSLCKPPGEVTPTA